MSPIRGKQNDIMQSGLQMILRRFGLAARNFPTREEKFAGYLGVNKRLLTPGFFGSGGTRQKVRVSQSKYFFYLYFYSNQVTIPSHTY